MTPEQIKTSLRLRQSTGWKEKLEYIERLERALGVASQSLEFYADVRTYEKDRDYHSNVYSDDGDKAIEALKEISDIMGGG